MNFTKTLTKKHSQKQPEEDVNMTQRRDRFPGIHVPPPDIMHIKQHLPCTSHLLRPVTQYIQYISTDHH